MKAKYNHHLITIHIKILFLLLFTILQACNAENRSQENTTTEKTATVQDTLNEDSAVFTGPAATVNNNIDIPSDGKACTLLAPEEVKQALAITDVNFRSVDTTVNRYGNACSYFWKGSDENFTNIASVYVPAANSNLATEATFRDELSRQGGKSTQKITQLGEEAYWFKELQQLYVINNGRWFYVSVALGKDQDEKQTLARARALAEKVITKL